MLRSQGKTPAQTLYAAIFSDARDNPETLFTKIGDRPARYYLKNLAREKKPAVLEQAASAPASSPSDYRQVANLLSLTSKLKLHNRWRKMDGAKFAPPRAGLSRHPYLNISKTI